MEITIGVIGGGNMGSAIIGGIRDKYKVLVSETDPKKARHVKNKYFVQTADLKTVVEQAEMLILAVKPQSMDLVLKSIKTLINRKTLIISIAAGIPTQYIEKRLDKGIKVVRTMPNLPAQTGQAMTALCRGKNASLGELKLAQKLFDCIGKTMIVEEKWIDAITAVSGSGPAYVFLFVEYFEKAAVGLGFKKEQAKTLVRQTLKGSLELLNLHHEEAHVLREQVTSKGGTTQAALEVFNKNKFDRIFKDALSAAKKRAKDLSRKS